MCTYVDIQFEFMRHQYDYEFERKAHFTTWLGLYLTINSVLFGLIFRAVHTGWIAMYIRVDIALYWLVTVIALVFAILAGFHFVRAFRFQEYQYLRPMPEYRVWMEKYIRENKIETVKHASFLREKQLEALSTKMGEAIVWNRKLNDARMAELEASRSWALVGYLCVLMQHLLILWITYVGVP